MSDNISQNKVVDITYLIKDESGTVIEQNDGSVSYLHGVQGDLLPALETALDGKTVGDTVEVELSPSETFGELDPNLIFTDKLDNVPEEYRQVGAQAQFQNENGETKAFVVSKIEGGEITFDGNHPFAGKTAILTFVANVKAIRDASEKEIADGRPAEELGLDAMNPPPVSDQH